MGEKEGGGDKEVVVVMEEVGGEGEGGHSFSHQIT
jgi:hypothetical protein